MGASIGDHLYNYHGSTDVLRALREGYANIHANLANNVTNMHSPTSTGGLIGLISGAAARWAQYKNR